MSSKSKKKQDTLDLCVLPVATLRRYQQFFALKSNVGRRELGTMVTRHFNAFPVEEGSAVRNFIEYVREQADED
ncbi:hypothetical protein GEMRC1_012224 [Eukaryota sp. GEM-RC1]